MLFQGLQYINFLFQSKNQHGVHSPFVYDFVTKCLYKKNDVFLLKAFKKIKKSLFSNLNFIEVRDFGSGSKLFKSNKRQISKIAKIAGISNKKVKILTKIITYFKPNTILEIGTSVGLSTSVFKISNRNANITTLEGCIETSSIAKDIFKNNNFKNIEILVGNFKNTLPKATERNEFDCIFFDGNHTKKATLNYFQECLKTVKNDSFWIFDDIYWSKEMKEAWLEIKNNNRVKVTVDLFYFGIVFFRNEQEKEHFKIRV